MRTRLSKSERRAAILKTASGLILEKGLTGTEMEDIRRASGISRGGLYHHFSNKRAVLDALIEEEVIELAQVLKTTDASPISALLLAGSSHLGTGPGVVSALTTRAEKLDYLSGLELAFASVLKDALAGRLGEHVRGGTNPEHVAELFLTINAHINRREILGDWTSEEAAGFAATSLQALAPLLQSPKELHPIIADLTQRASAS